MKRVSNYCVSYRDSTRSSGDWPRSQSGKSPVETCPTAVSDPTAVSYLSSPSFRAEWRDLVHDRSADTWWERCRCLLISIVMRWAHYLRYKKSRTLSWRSRKRWTVIARRCGLREPPVCACSLILETYLLHICICNCRSPHKHTRGECDKRDAFVTRVYLLIIIVLVEILLYMIRSRWRSVNAIVRKWIRIITAGAICQRWVGEVRCALTCIRSTAYSRLTESKIAFEFRNFAT